MTNSKLNHECGLCAIVSKKNKNVINKTIFYLNKLQHRGQDSCGISYLKDNNIKVIKNVGLIKDNLKNIKDKASIALCHTRYSTKGDITQKNAQPIVFNNVALAHNGTIFEIEKYKNILLQKNFIFDGTNDSEVILKWLFYKIKKEPDFWTIDDIKNAMDDFKNGAYCIILMFEDRLIAFKDEFSYRPLVLAETKDDYIFSSEDIINNAIKKFELKGNSFVEIKNNKVNIKQYPIETQNRCPFEVVYFAKNNVFNCDIKSFRINLGKILANYDKNLKADFIVPILNSGLYGAIGYHKQSKIKLKKLIQTKTFLRTFIENNFLRDKSLNTKYTIKNVKNKDIVVVDDSIVRGNTSKKIIELLKKAGANKIHLRLTSPMIVNSCFWGVDVPDKNDLLAYKLKTEDNIRKYLEIDSVKFISYDDFFEVFDKNLWCDKCFKN